MRTFARHLAASLVLAGGLVAGAAAPAAANHIAAMAVTQAGSNGPEITLQVDLTASGASGGATFNWDTGDGRSGWVDDGIVNGAYAGDASGSGTFSSGSGRLGTFTWQRTQPVVGTARTRITYVYGRAGAYTVSWSDCCPTVSGTTAVSVSGNLPACSDGVDNDGDGSVDYPADPGCAGEDDTSELADCPPDPLGVQFCLLPGPVKTVVEVRNVDVTPGPEHTVVGYLDTYRFQVGPLTTSLPCVRLLTDGSGPNPCAAAGGTYVGTDRVLTLVDQREPKVTWGPVIASQGVCTAELVAKFGPFGIDSAPALTLCQAGNVAA